LFFKRATKQTTIDLAFRVSAFGLILRPYDTTLPFPEYLVLELNSRVLTGAVLHAPREFLG
jgi:hypothetical protein